MNIKDYIETVSTLTMSITDIKINGFYEDLKSESSVVMFVNKLPKNLKENNLKFLKLLNEIEAVTYLIVGQNIDFDKFKEIGFECVKENKLPGVIFGKNKGQHYDFEIYYDEIKKEIENVNFNTPIDIREFCFDVLNFKELYATVYLPQHWVNNDVQMYSIDRRFKLCKDGKFRICN